MPSDTENGLTLAELLITTKDGDWAKDEPREGCVPYRVIRGADFPETRLGIITGVPRCYLDESTVQRRSLEPGDILIETAGGNRDRPTGRTLLITKRLLDSFDLPATCASFCRFMRVDREKADPEYVYWYLQHLYNRGDMWEHQVQHTGVARFQYTRFANSVRIPLPPRHEQSQITRILGSLDDKIEMNRRMNETLERMARTLFRSWFVDFDPVRSKAEGRQPHGLDAETAKLFPDKFEDSPLGKVPKGWKVGPLRQLLCVSREGLNPGDHPTEDFDHYSLPAFDNGRLPQAEPGLSIKSNKFVVPSDSVLISKLNPRIPRAWFPSVRRDRRSVCSTEFIVCLPRPGCSREFLHSYLSSTAITEEFSLLVTGTSGSHQRVQPDDLLRLEAVIPDERGIRAFTEVVRPIYQRIVENLEESQALSATRDALLPKLLSGEIRVNETNLIAEEAG